MARGPAKSPKKKVGKVAKKKFKLNRKVWIEADMFESAAFRSLSSKAMWALLRFLQKRTWEKAKIGRGKTQTIYQTEGLSFSYTEAEAFGISKAQFHRILKKLVERGFLDPEHRGGAYGRDYSRYAMSDRWRNYGQPNFEFKTLERVLLPGHDVQSRIAK